MSLSHPKIASLVANAVVLGIRRANADYEKLSGLEWVSDRGVESFVAGRVAHKIKRLNRLEIKRVLLEVSFAELSRDYIHEDQRNIDHGWPAGGRIDIVALGPDDLAIGAVELKRNVFFDAWKRDVERIASQCTDVSGIRFSAFAGFLSEQKVGTRSSNVGAEEVKRHCRKLSSANNIQFTEISFVSGWKEYTHGDFRFHIVGCVFTKKK